MQFNPGVPIAPGETIASKTRRYGTGQLLGFAIVARRSVVESDIWYQQKGSQNRLG